MSTQRRRVPWGLVALALFLVALALAWRLTPLSEWAQPDRLAEQARPYTQGVTGPLVAVGAFVVGGVLVLPVTVLILVTALVFEPVSAAAWSFVGCLASAALTYWIGRAAGQESVSRLAGSRVDAVARWLSRRGIASIAVVRVVPVAPFSVVNAVAGAVRVRFVHYLTGTAVGMAPGIVLITLAGDRIAAAVRDPEPAHVVVAVAAVALVVAAGWAGKRLLERRGGGEGRAEGQG